MKIIIPKCIKWRVKNGVIYVDLSEATLENAICPYCKKRLCKDGTYKKTIKLLGGKVIIILTLPRLCCRHKK